MKPTLIKFTSLLLLLFVQLHPGVSLAMGLRSFVALPLDTGGTVLRAFNEIVTDRDINISTANIAYGLSESQTFFAAVPYRTAGGNGDRLGDVSLLYRHRIWQRNKPGQTYRLALLAGGTIPADSARDPGILAGAVYTAYWGRHELDVDFLWSEGLSGAPDTARYDLSWQYRLAPAEYPDWGLPSQWNTVLELSGRWQSGSETVHFITAGIQKVWPQWVLEGGLSQDIEGGQDTGLIFSIRYHR